MEEEGNDTEVPLSPPPSPSPPHSSHLQEQALLSSRFQSRLAAFKDKQKKFAAMIEEDGSDGEKDTCRVCRSGSTPNRPLFYPCRCSGSIKYIHEDCLMTWLSHSRVKHCELCTTKYRFTPVYAPNTPSIIPISDLISGGVKRSINWVKYMGRIAAVLFVWFVFVPLCTAWIAKLFLGSLRMNTMQEIVQQLHLRGLILDCIAGLIMSGVIILLLLGLSSLVEYIQINPIHHPNEEAREELNAQGNMFGFMQNRPHPANNPPNNNINEDLDLEDFIGLRGPLNQLFEKCLLVIGCFTVFLAVAILLPKTLAKIVIYPIDGTLSWNSSLEYSMLPLKSIIDNESQYLMKEVMTILFGYGIIATMAGLSQAIQFIDHHREHDFSQFAILMSTVIKVTIIILIEGGLFPLGAGYGLHFALKDCYQFGSMGVDEMSFLEKYPIFSIFLHWLGGLFFMFNFASAVGWLRAFLREGVLWFFKNPNDPNFDPLKEMIEVPMIRHIRGMILSGIMYGFIIYLLVAGPIYACKYIFPTLIPLRLWISSMYQLPLDFVSIHIIILLTREYFQPTQLLKKVATRWFQVIGHYLDLTSYLFAESGVQVVKPKRFGFRIVALLLAGLGSLFLLHFSMLVFPIGIGRFLIFSVLGIEVSDIYSFSLGFHFLWIASIGINMIRRNFNTPSIGQIVMYVGNVFLIGLKWILLSIIFLGILPLLIGLLLDLSFLVVLRCQINETPNIFIYHDWAFGLVYFKLWFRLVLLDVFPSWKEKFDKIHANGIWGVNVSEIILDVVLPIIFPLSIMLSVPYTFSKGIAPLFISNIYILSGLYRYSHLGTVLGFLTYYFLVFVTRWFPKFKQTIIDEKYLVGLKLHNFTES